MADGTALIVNLRRTVLAVVALALVALTACSASASTDAETTARDPDAVALEAMADDARRLVQETESTAVLRQIGVGVSSGQYLFHFTDAASTLVVVAPGMDSPPESWEVHPPSVSPLVGHVAADLSMGSLRTGPDAVQRAASSHWGSCENANVGLTGEGDDLVWYVFCELPEGVLSGTGEPASLSPPALLRPSGHPPPRPSLKPGTLSPQAPGSERSQRTVSELPCAILEHRVRLTPFRTRLQ